MQTYIRELEESDIKILSSINDQKAKYVIEELKYSEELNNTYVYGIFIEDKLIGFCSISLATDMPCTEYWYTDSRTISDFYILEEYRNQGYGSELLSEVIHLFSNSKSIFFEAESNDIAEFCIKLGFKDCNNDFLVFLNNKED